MPSTVILGGGIIGLSTAYYLSKLASPSSSSPHSIHIVEPSPELFASASGKAAGFLAKDWFAPAVAPLGLLSFDLHQQLAKEHNGRARWGYSESIGYSLDRDYEPDPEPPASEVSEGRSTNGGGEQGGLDWLMNDGSRASVVDQSDTLASSVKGGTRDGPLWLRCKPGSLQAVSERTNTAQV